MHWSRVSRLFILLITVILVAGPVGCGGEREGAVPSDTNRLPVYTIADSTGDWGFPNPYTCYERGPGYIRMSLIFETLTWKDADGIVPALAESWDYNEAENSFTFVLRDDVTWHDGQPFTADDVVFTYAYMREHPYYLVDTAAIVESVTAAGNKVTMTLAEPYAPFLESVAGTVPILPQHIWQHVDQPEDYRAPESVVGTGPFRFGDYNQELGTYRYLANDDYYGGEVTVGELRFVKVAEEMIAGALRSGEVNAGSIQPEVADAVGREGYTVMPGGNWSTTKLMFNHHKAPLDRKEMRQALAWAIDREQLTEIVRKGKAEPGSAGYIPPDNKWFAPTVEQYSHDPSRTAALLGELGYVRRDGVFMRDGKPLALELIYSAGAGAAGQARDAEMIKRQLEEAGFKINLRNMESKTRDDRVLKWDFDIALNSHGGLGGDPAQFNLVVLHQGFNSTRYEDNAELTALLKKQMTTMDAGRRLEMVRRAQELFADEMPSLTLYYPIGYFAHDGKVSLFYTAGGVSGGIPIAINRLAFVQN